ncbi:hypothetical protein Q2T41_16805 [Maribacter confluentis]|uniref:Uncharacterized protein n=1 Tax=Maribacter confluentis TaxID=1656093 RepID=A0ABT8RTQ6_9FLAO|nr:hypothetical protein [Maribacter confluentis]MDO1514316.1 hypothetical protein [Maribacter confluentis]
MEIKKKIILRPVGGLCNRLRALDSFFEICKKYNFDLEVLWTTDVTLNSTFDSLFDPISFNDIKVTIINCPDGFPERNLVKIGKSSAGDFAIDLNKISNPVKNYIKKLITTKNLSLEHRKILAEIKKLGFNAVIRNENLDKVYLQNSSLETNIRVLDQNFIDRITPIISDAVNNSNKLYINCCYRVAELKSNYDYLRPIDSIGNKINSISENFGENMIGLHVRRTDHVASKAISSNDKFKKVVDAEIENNADVKFYLSTDDPVFKDDFIKAYPNKIITNDVNSYDRNNSLAIQDAVVDLFCLSKTNKIYGSHQSSFSQTAADLGGKKEIIV